MTTRREALKRIGGSVLALVALPTLVTAEPAPFTAATLDGVGRSAVPVEPIPYDNAWSAYGIEHPIDLRESTDCLNLDEGGTWPRHIVTHITRDTVTTTPVTSVQFNASMKAWQQANAGIMRGFNDGKRKRRGRR